MLSEAIHSLVDTVTGLMLLGCTKSRPPTPITLSVMRELYFGTLIVAILLRLGGACRLRGITHLSHPNHPSNPAWTMGARLAFLFEGSHAFG